MRNLSTLFLITLTLGLGGLVTINSVSGSLDSIFGSPALQEGDLVYRFDPKDVTDIQITSQDGTNAIIKKKGGAWQLEEPYEDLADARLIQSILDFSKTLVVEDVIELDEVEDLADYGLKSTRIEVKLMGSNGRSLSSYRLGRNTAWRSLDEDGNNFPTVIIHPAERELRDHLYVCTDRADPKLRTVGIRTLFDHSLKLFRDHRAFYNHPFFATEITLRDRSSEISLARPNIAKGTPWRITKPFDLAANEPAVQKVLGELGNLQGIEVLDPSAVTLPAPTPENIERTIRAKFSLPGGRSEEISVFIYPPEKEDSPTVLARLGQSPESLRPAVLRFLRGPKSILAGLPKGVNQLRSRTLTSLEVRQLKSLRIKDAGQGTVRLGLEWNPHERANRWHSIATNYNGPANEEQVKNVFEALFKKPIIRFADDAVTDLAIYGLDKPLREVELTLKDDKKIVYEIGKKQEKSYFVREANGDKATPVTKDLFEALKKGRGGEQIAPLFQQGNTQVYPVKNPRRFGFRGGNKAQVNVGGSKKTIELGEIKQPHFYASEKDSRRVVEIPPSFYYTLATEDYRWRQTRLWNLDAFEVRGMVVERNGRPPLTLSYNFFRSEWQAQVNGQDVTARLNKNKADRLLEYLVDLRVSRWLGSTDDQAATRLISPNLKLSVLTEEVGSDGEIKGLRRQELKIAQVQPGAQNDFFYGKTSSDPDYFLLNLATIQRLAVNLLD